MLDLDTQQLVREAVLLKASNGDMFTAHDITRAVRARVGRHVDVPHHDVKLVVHEMFETNNIGADYTRKLASFPGVSPVPWIYHKISDDPANYKKPPDTLPPPPSGLSIVAGAAPAQVSHHVDARKTLMIPARFIREVGLVHTNQAFVYKSLLGDCVYLAGTEPHVDFAEYTVDYHGNVRITQATLQRFGQPGDQYFIELSDNELKITAKKV